VKNRLQGRKIPGKVSWEGQGKGPWWQVFVVMGEMKK